MDERHEMARSKTPGAAQLTLLLFIISCVLSRASCFNIFSHFFSRTHIRDAEDEVNPFSAVQHVPEAPTPPPPSLLDKTLVFGPTGLPPANETCFNGTEAPDPRAQNILIALEA